MTIDEAIEFHKRASEELFQRSEDYKAEKEYSKQVGEDAKKHKQEEEWLEELKTLRYCKDKWNENQYQQGRADAINAIKNDLHKRLTEEMNNPYQDQGLCKGLHCGIQLCDWYLDDSKEQKE